MHLLTAINLDLTEWTSVKEKLGLDFPNVRSSCGIRSSTFLWVERGWADQVAADLVKIGEINEERALNCYRSSPGRQNVLTELCLIATTLYNCIGMVGQENKNQCD